MKARVTVYPRREILDPQGKAIRDALNRVGFPGVEDVRAGKSFEISLGSSDPEAANRELRDMCEKLLANTVVEDYSVELLSETEVRP
ncbi:MAG TPA: phosphoribosylformylglycinamidine synthase subunit PurS [Thermoanaerobaculia bacterium]|nr:phosphoribosylformylglycinamidine synthase subunit PurS [Thermoanaerobaculia bacterium]